MKIMHNLGFNFHPKFIVKNSGFIVKIDSMKESMIFTITVLTAIRSTSARPVYVELRAGSVPEYSRVIIAIKPLMP